MANTFNIPLANPVRFIDTSDINAGFDGNFAAYQVLSYQNSKCYFQKWAISNILRLQILSDFIPTNLEIRDLATNKLLASVPWFEAVSKLVGQTFKVYEIEFSLSALPVGRFYLKFTYTDALATVHPLVSEPMELAISQPNTVNIQYTHSKNAFNLIFETETPIVFEFRCEAAVKNFNPENDRDIYIDQVHNATLLDAVPFRSFKFFVGFKWGLVAWVVDKINRIQSMDSVRYDGIYYEVMPEAKYEAEYNDSNAYMGVSIDIQSTQNNFENYVIDDSDDDNTFSPMQKKINFNNVGADISVNGYFRNRSQLEMITVFKRVPADPGTIELLVGTTPGGNEIDTITVDKDAFSQTLVETFTGNTTVYLSGLTGVDCDIVLVYNQLDEPDVSIGNPVTPPQQIKKGITALYTEVNPGDLQNDFDLATGLGKINSGWGDWVISGTNGTLSYGGMVPVGYDPANPKYNLSKVGTTGGAETVTLTPGQLPKIDLKGYGVGGIDNNPNGGGLGYNRAPQPKDKPLDSFGNNEAHSNMQPFRISIYITKVS